jgi:hypothetical protein
VSYWNGTSWAAVDDLSDQTSLNGDTLGQDGFISWTNKADWVKKSLTGVDTDIQLYWIKVTVSANLSASTKLHSVLNLFCDQTLLSAYYPEIVSNTAFLPRGKQNFLDQLIAAKDLIVTRLKQRHLIEDESQVIDINSVAMAAVHACAWIILAPIATSDSTKELRDQAFKAMNDEVNQLSLGVDQDKDGIVTEAERSSISSITTVVRR